MSEPTILLCSFMAAVTIMSCFHIVFTNKRMTRQAEINAKLAMEADREHNTFLGGPGVRPN